MQEETITLSSQLDRIKNATDSIRVVTDTTGAEIETVAQAVSDVVDDNAAKDATIADLNDEIERITPKGTTTITANGTFDISSYASVNVNLDPSALEYVVGLWDYDGTLIKEYTKTEFLALEQLPSTPTHAGLISQGWNWTLAQAKEYVEGGGEVDIGPTYATDDNSTRIHISLENAQMLEPTLNLAVQGTATINWGDNSPVETITGSGVTAYDKQSISHTYSQTGDYVITIYSDGSYATLLEDGVIDVRGDLLSPGFYYDSIHEINCANNFILGRNAFYQAYYLYKITLPLNCPQLGYWALGVAGLKGLILPNGYTTLDEGSIRSLGEALVLSLPYTLTSLGPSGSNDFSSSISFAYKIKRVALPSITELPMMSCNKLYGIKTMYIPNVVTANDSITHCSLLTKIIAPKLRNSGTRSISFGHNPNLTYVEVPSLVTVPSNMFYQCTSLAEVTLPNVTKIEKQGFYECSALKKIVAPKLTSVGESAFTNTSLAEIDLSKVITIGNYAFSDTALTFMDLSKITGSLQGACASMTRLQDVVLPENLTSIAQQMFSGCTSLTDVKLREILALPKLTSIGNSAFYKCNFTGSLTIPKNITNLGSTSFGSNKQLTQVSLPGVTNMNTAFQGLPNLREIDAPRATSLAQYGLDNNPSLLKATFNCLTSVNNYAFRGAHAGLIADFSEQETIPSGSRYSFQNVNNPIIVVPEHLYDSWVSSFGWSYYPAYCRKDTQYYGYTKNEVQINIQNGSGQLVDNVTEITIFDNDKNREVYYSTYNNSIIKHMVVGHSYTIHVEAVGYQPQDCNYTIEAGTTNLNIIMTSLPKATLTINIWDGDSGQHAGNNFNIYIYGVEETDLYTSSPATVQLLPGHYNIDVSDDAGMYWDSRSIDISGETATVDFYYYAEM